MIDWTKSMQQTFEFYVVDPATWYDIEKLTKVKSCTITRDSSLDTLGSATLDADEDLNGRYVRVYLIATQNGETEKVPLGTHMYQSPSTVYDGKRHALSHDGYTPLIELKEKPMPIGYQALSGVNILDLAQTILEDDSIRAPIVHETGSVDKTLAGSFLADISDTRLTFVSDLLYNANYTLGLDELGKVLFMPDKELAAMAPVWTYSDDNSSILYPDLTISRDIFGIPNKIEVVYSESGSSPIIATHTNEDPESIVSHQQRGRWIIHRETDPDIAPGANQAQLNEYAYKKLRELSTVDYQISYKHGYCPVRLGDCVRLNYRRADFYNENAKVTRQVIHCEEGCQVEETAILTEHLWEGEQ